MLLVVGADPDQGDDTADRPLHYSARYGKLSNLNFIVLSLQKRLIQFHSYHSGREKVTDLLIRYNADYEVRNLFGETPLMLAMKYGNFPK